LLEFLLSGLVDDTKKEKRCLMGECLLMPGGPDGPDPKSFFLRRIFMYFITFMPNGGDGPDGC